MIPPRWRDGEVAVIGLGRSGRAAAVWLAKSGIRIYASDLARSPAVTASAASVREAGGDVDIGRHDLERIGRAVAVVVSPGVPPEAPPVMAARHAGVEVVAELNLGVLGLEHASIIAVTGTNGKTTTTAFTAHLLHVAGVRAVAAGNIGRPVADVAAASEQFDWIVLEASSFQLHDAPDLAPEVGVVTNLDADHLDRYRDVDSYFADKQQLFRNATPHSTWVLNADDAAVEGLAGTAPGRRRRFSIARPADAWYDRENDRLMLGGEPLLTRSAVRLLGDHNVANALAAALAAHAAGASRSQLTEGLASFAPLPHRLEPVGDIDGVLWINDSKATNVASATVAVRAMSRQFVVVLGGRDKGGGAFERLRGGLEQCRGVVAYGEAAPAVANALGDEVGVRRIDGFDDAVRIAATMTEVGDALLLSPACASFDQFGSYEERGERFRALAGNT